MGENWNGVAARQRKKVWEYVYYFRHNARTWRTDKLAHTGRRRRSRVCIASRGKNSPIVICAATLLRGFCVVAELPVLHFLNSCELIRPVLTRRTMFVIPMIHLKQPLVSPIFARCVKLRHKTAHKYRRPLSLQQRSIPVQLDQGLRSIAVRLCLSAARIQWQRTHTRLLAVAGRHASWQM